MTWEPPADWVRVYTIDAHAAGEPLRVILSGFPPLQGDTILERRRDARDNHDALRRALMLEPRGHADMYGCLPMPPATPDGDLGVLFLHNEGYSTMCGHGVIGMLKVVLDCGLIELASGESTVKLDTPAGRVTATVERSDGVVTAVRFLNVPSFLMQAEVEVEVPGIGKLTADIGYGGAFYAYVDAASAGLALVPEQFAAIRAAGIAVKQAVMDALPMQHPDGDADLEFLYGVIFTQPGSDTVHSRHCCVFADGEVDRSPTGTGVSGRAAVLHAKGQLALGDSLTIDGIVGQPFDVRVAETIGVGDKPGIVPEVRGTAHITGRHEFLIDPADPLRDGFLLR